MNRSMFIGWDPRESDAWWVAQQSLLRHLSKPITVRKLALDDLRDRGLYTRPTRREGNRLIDELSARADYDGSISTEHANARFFVPLLARGGWAGFMDGDMLVRKDLVPMFDSLDPKYAVYCVQHIHCPEGSVKMDGQVQTKYQRKNWSSFMIFNCDHPGVRDRFVETFANEWPGRDLHAFRWLGNHEIGELPQEFNYLVGYTDHLDDPAVVHFTEGTPDMPGYENCEFADEWRAELARQLVPRYDSAMTDAAE